MERRNFIKKSALASNVLPFSGSLMSFDTQQKTNEKHDFNLKYAPHIGMFENPVGDDPKDQLNFMAHQGFTAFDDNTMRKRDVALQENMANML